MILSFHRLGAHQAFWQVLPSANTCVRILSGCDLKLKTFVSCPDGFAACPLPTLYRSLEKRIERIFINLLPAKFSSVLTEFIQVSLLMPESGQGLFKWIVRKGKSWVAFGLISGFEGGGIPNGFKFLLVKLKRKKKCQS